MKNDVIPQSYISPDKWLTPHSQTAKIKVEKATILDHYSLHVECSSKEEVGINQIIRGEDHFYKFLSDQCPLKKRKGELDPESVSVFRVSDLHVGSDGAFFPVVEPECTNCSNDNPNLFRRCTLDNCQEIIKVFMHDIKLMKREFDPNHRPDSTHVKRLDILGDGLKTLNEMAEYSTDAHKKKLIDLFIGFLELYEPSEGLKKFLNSKNLDI